MDAIRCFTCNKVIGGKWEKYRSLCQQLENPSAESDEEPIIKSYDDIMAQLGISRWCCKRMFLTGVNVTEKIIDYNQVHDVMKANPYVHYKTTSVDSTKRIYLAR
jgi:DNA-directed RNA polymerase subunit N (RpoN/RPB10)